MSCIRIPACQGVPLLYSAKAGSKPNSLPTIRTEEGDLPEVRRPGRGAENSPPSSSEV
jgi:hypothetical protein